MATNDEDEVSNKQDEKGRDGDNIGGNVGWDKAKKILSKGWPEVFIWNTNTSSFVLKFSKTFVVWIVIIILSLSIYVNISEL